MLFDYKKFGDLKCLNSVLKIDWCVYTSIPTFKDNLVYLKKPYKTNLKNVNI